MRINIITYILFFIVLIAFSCNKENVLTGNWSVIDSNGDYAEFHISEDKIHIYYEKAGTLPFQTYSFKNDSLFTSKLNYKIEWISNDSILFTNDKLALSLSKIKSGYTFNKVKNDKDMKVYKQSFYKRLELYKK